MNSSQEFMNILDELQKSDSEINGAILASKDGFTVASTLPADFDIDAIGAITASTIKIGEETIQEFHRNKLDHILIKGKQGFIVLKNIQDSMLLVVLASHNIKLGVLFINVKNTAAKIAEKL